MRQIKLYLPFVLILFMGCYNGKDRDSASPNKIAKYKETPAFIQKYLDSVSHGRFFIAERGEKWNAGCIIEENTPSYQFISASLNNNQYKLKFWSGGLVTVKELITVNFKDEMVTSYLQSVSEE